MYFGDTVYISTSSTIQRNTSIQCAKSQRKKNKSLNQTKDQTHLNQSASKKGPGASQNPATPTNVKWGMARRLQKKATQAGSLFGGIAKDMLKQQEGSPGFNASGPSIEQEMQKEEIREVNASIEFKSKLKINFYSQFSIESKDWIQCGDIFWLNHLDTVSLLVAKKKIDAAKD